MSRQFVSLSTIVVREYDEAIEYYVNTLGFRLREDTPLGSTKRWIVVSLDDGNSHGILLALATNDAQRARIGDQTGGRVAFFLQTEDFETSYSTLRERGVNFCESPRQEAYGTVAVFADLYGNLWDLVQLG